ncbi:MAG TPA: hypothetical protein PK006_00940 [Saprospiraceae bacterium]|nr:hypothetical protein [Saprospiraceae bacterium]
MDLKESLSNAGKTTWKWVKISLLVVLLLLIAYVCFLLFANFSEGTRTGYVTKISKKGYVFKTHEGELNTGFFTNPGRTGVSPDNVWYFSVPDDNTAQQIQKASESGKKVTLHYQQKYKQLFFRGDTEYLVDKIDFAAE